MNSSLTIAFAAYSWQVADNYYHDLPCFIRRIEHFAIHDKTSAYINLG